MRENKKFLITLAIVALFFMFFGGWLVEKIRRDPIKKQYKESEKRVEKLLDSISREKEANERAKKINRQNRKDVKKKYKDAADVDYNDNQLDSLLTAFERKSDGR